MEAVVSFLEKIGSGPRMNPGQLAQASAAADLASECRSALLAHNGKGLASHSKGMMAPILWIDDDHSRPQ